MFLILPSVDMLSELKWPMVRLQVNGVSSVRCNSRSIVKTCIQISLDSVCMSLMRASGMVG